MVEVLDDDIMDIPPLKFDADEFSQFERSYDKDRDILFVYKLPKRPAVSLDVGGHFWVRFDPESGEVLGVEIEDFESVFLAKYPELRLGWEDTRKRLTKRPKMTDDTVADYLLRLLLSIKNILRDHQEIATA